MNLLPRSIADGHYRALDEILEERSEYDLEQLVPLLIDNLNASALVHVAEWFSVLGVEGWNFVHTDEDKRALLKEAIEIHRHKGTPWSIEKALNRAGFEVSRIEEGTKNYSIPVAKFIQPKQPLKFDGIAKFNGAYSFGDGLRALAPIQFDGAHKFDGSHKFGDSVNVGTVDSPSSNIIAWALFRVVLVWNGTDDYTPTIHDTVVAIIESFKPARCWLTDVGLTISIAETVSVPSEALSSTMQKSLRDIVGGGFLFDGSRQFDGTSQFTAGVEDEAASSVSNDASETISITESTTHIIT